MRGITKALVLSGLLTAEVSARDVPANIKALYSSIRANGKCSNILQGGFYSQEKDSKGNIEPLTTLRFLY